MGGHLGGERASRMAVEILEREIADVRKAGQFDVRARPTRAPGAPHPVAAILRKAVVEADRHIYEAALANPELAGMGTTLTTLLFYGGYVHMGHVGDSRAYLYRDGRARQLSEDHSWIQEQVRAGPDLARGGEGVALPQHHHPLGRLRAERRARPAGAVRAGRATASCSARTACRTT